MTDERARAIEATMSPPDKLAIPVGAEPRRCKGCQALIYFVHNHNNRITPVNLDGMPHHVTCPKAAQFRKARRDPVQETIAKEHISMLDYLKSRPRYLKEWQVKFVTDCRLILNKPTANLSRNQASTLRDIYEHQTR